MLYVFFLVRTRRRWPGLRGRVALTAVEGLGAVGVAQPARSRAESRQRISRMAVGNGSGWNEMGGCSLGGKQPGGYLAARRGGDNPFSRRGNRTPALHVKRKIMVRPTVRGLWPEPERGNRKWIAPAPRRAVAGVLAGATHTTSRAAPTASFRFRRGRSWARGRGRRGRRGRWRGRGGASCCDTCRSAGRRRGGSRCR